MVLTSGYFRIPQPLHVHRIHNKCLQNMVSLCFSHQNTNRFLPRFLFHSSKDSHMVTIQQSKRGEWRVCLWLDSTMSWIRRKEEGRGREEELAATHAAQFSEHAVGPLLYLINFILLLSVISVFKSTITSNGIWHRFHKIHNLLQRLLLGPLMQLHRAVLDRPFGTNSHTVCNGGQSPKR